MFVKIGARRKTDDLVELLLECHERIRAFTRTAQELARRDDLAESDILDAAERVHRYFSEALPLHVQDEEQSLLPRLKGKTQDVDVALTTMNAQHAEHVPQLAALLDALELVKAQPKARDPQSRLKAVVEPLALAFEEHLALEEAVIFPAVRAVLSESTQLLIMDELRARRRPTQS